MEMKRRVIRFSLMCIGTAIGLLALLWAAFGFSRFGMEGHVLVALALGGTGTIALGSILMALLFASERGEEP
jgi:hypothetical protein